MGFNSGFKGLKPVWDGCDISMHVYWRCHETLRC